MMCWNVRACCKGQAALAVRVDEDKVLLIREGFKMKLYGMIDILILPWQIFLSIVLLFQRHQKSSIVWTWHLQGFRNRLCKGSHRKSTLAWKLALETVSKPPFFFKLALVLVLAVYLSFPSALLFGHHLKTVNGFLLERRNHCYR